MVDNSRNVIVLLNSVSPQSRPALSSDEWTARYPRQKKEKSSIHRSQLCPSSQFSLKKTILRLIPILSWLPKYKWKEDTANDVVAGLTVAVMHIPQAMAYAILAGVEPVYGIYTSVFPVLMYMVLGTSRHCSMGTSPIAGILTAKVVQQHTMDMEYTSIEVAVACSFAMGIIHTGLGLFRLGSIKVILTDALVSGFTVGAAIHVLTSQLKYVLGLYLEQSPKGPGKIIFTFIEIFKVIEKTNLLTLSISAVSLVALLAVSIWVGPQVKKLCRFPIPIQLFVIVIATILSHFLDLRTSHGVQVISDIGDIIPGLPSPVAPRWKLIPLVFMESIPIAVISFVINQGLGIMFADKHGYKISANQELVASGASNLLGSVFSCIPMAASMSRSLVQEASGSRSLLTALVSSASLIAVLLWLGPFFTSLPICILASIILAALKGMLLKMKDVKMFYSRSGWDAAVWLVTFTATVLLDIDMGLVVGILFAVALVLIRSCVPSVEVLQLDSKGEVWLNKKIYMTENSPHVVLQIKGPLQFLSAKYVKYLVVKEIGSIIHTKAATDNKTFDGDHCAKIDIDNQITATTVVLDLSQVSFVDADGLKTLQQLKTRFEGSGMACKISGNNLSILRDLKRGGILSFKAEDIHPTYIDAVQYNSKKK